MDVNDKIWEVSNHVFRTCVEHINAEIKAGNKDYIELGIDEDFQLYEEFFKEVIARSLGVKKKRSSSFPRRILDEWIGMVKKASSLFPGRVVRECAGVIKKEIKLKGYSRLLKHDILVPYVVYEVCLLILKRIDEKEFSQV